MQALGDSPAQASGSRLEQASGSGSVQISGSGAGLEQALGSGPEQAVRYGPEQALESGPEQALESGPEQAPAAAAEQSSAAAERSSAAADHDPGQVLAATPRLTASGAGVSEAVRVDGKSLKDLKNPWNIFQIENKGKGWSPQVMAAMYKQWLGGPLDNYSLQV